jgi:hypothetical protein
VPSTFAANLYPVPRRFINLGKEGTAGTLAAATYTFPMTTFKPVDKYTRLKDSAWRNAMGDVYNLIDGVRVADISMGGPVFGDGIGYPLLSIFGDYYQSVTGTSTTATTLAAPYTAGAATLSVTSASQLSTGSTFAVGALNSTAEEVRTVTTLSGTTVTPNIPLYQSHLSGAAVTPYSAVTTYNHFFALLNSGSGAGGFSQAQPATYTYQDVTGVTATSGARNYLYSCPSELTIDSTATELLMWEAKMTALASGTAASAPTTSLSSVAPQAAWRSTVTLNSSQDYEEASWKVMFNRKVEPKFVNANQQDPFAIARGYFGVTFSLDIDPAINEADFLLYLQNTQPTLSLVASNGLAGSSAVTVTITANQLGFDAGAIEDSKDVFGYALSGLMVDNVTNVGPSGGFGPCIVEVQNQVVSY